MSYNQYNTDPYPTTAYSQAGGPYSNNQTRTGNAMQPTVPAWTAQYGAFQDPMYLRYFETGDFNRVGYLDENGLQAALAAAGVPALDPETVEMMIMMFDTDNNRRIDFPEFVVLMNYVNSMKSSYTRTATSNPGGVVGTRDASMLMSNTHGAFMSNIGGPDVVERGILPTINPSSQGFFSIGNFIKIAIIIGLMRTLYEHNKLPFFSNNHGAQGGMGSLGVQGGMGGQPSIGSQYGQPNDSQQHLQPQKSGGLLGRIVSSLSGRM